MGLTPVEHECLESFRRSGSCWPDAAETQDDEAWVRFGLAAALRAGQIVRGLRIASLVDETTFKEDASPVTRAERRIEATIRDRLARFRPEASFMGEEGGGAMAATGVSVAVDPVDGTWALLNRMSACAATVAVLRDGAPFLGVVVTPSSGEIGYAIDGRPTRLIQLAMLGDEDRAVDLPLDRVRADSILVDLHPARSARSLADRLMAAWQSGEVQLVRMQGGSPALALHEAAKGSFVYVNAWDKRPAAPFDLTAGVLLVRNAGGRVVDLRGRDIDCRSHAGPFVAGVDDAAREAVVAIVAHARS